LKITKKEQDKCFGFINFNSLEDQHLETASGLTPVPAGMQLAQELEVSLEQKLPSLEMTSHRRWEL